MEVGGEGWAEVEEEGMEGIGEEKGGRGWGGNERGGRRMVI